MKSSPRTMRVACDRAGRRSFLPVLVFAALTMVGALAPPVMLAADSTVDTQRNVVVVFTVIILLIGSVTAGLVFASPLRRRLTSTVVEADPLTDVDHEPAPMTSGELLEPLPPSAQPTLPSAAPAWPATLPVESLMPTSVLRPMTAPAQPSWSANPQPTTPAQPSWPATAQPTPPARPPWPATDQPDSRPQPAQQPAQAAPPPVQPAAPPRALAPPRPAATPWSTGSVQPDRNWNPKQREER